MAWRRSIFVVVVGALGCATGDDPPPGPDVLPGLDGYRHRRVIKLSSSTPEDFAIAFELDHAALVGDGKALEDGSDVRIGYEQGEDRYEIDRVLDTVTAWNENRAVIWFRTQGAGDHYVYYGHDNPEEAMEDPNRVFDGYEAFDGPDVPEGWEVTTVGNAEGSASVTNGAVSLSGGDRRYRGHGGRLRPVHAGDVW